MKGEWVDRTALYNARRKNGGALLKEEGLLPGSLRRSKIHWQR